MTELLGIFQGDVILRSAVVEALRRLRDSPQLVDDVFRSLAEDHLTSADYGEKEMEQAKNWFLKTEIPVSMSWRLDEPKFPIISISQQESAEAENTLGDVHYVTSEETEADWPAISGPFSPVSFSPSSGLMVIPQGPLGQLVLAPGMYIVDHDGRPHLVEEVLDDDTVSIAAGTVADFRGSILKGAKPRLVTMVESANFRETYQIGCHVQGESFYLTWLHSVLTFALLKYRQELLEARGFERSSVVSSEFRRNGDFDQEIVYSRGITVTGYVRQYWPKDVTEQIQATGTQVVVRTSEGTAELQFDDGFSVGVENNGEVEPL